MRILPFLSLLLLSIPMLAQDLAPSNPRAPLSRAGQYDIAVSRWIDLQADVVGAECECAAGSMGNAWLLKDLNHDGRLDLVLLYQLEWAQQYEFRLAIFEQKSKGGAMEFRDQEPVSGEDEGAPTLARSSVKIKGQTIRVKLSKGSIEYWYQGGILEQREK